MYTTSDNRRPQYISNKWANVKGFMQSVQDNEDNQQT